MKRGYVVAGIFVIALLALGALFLPSYFAKKGLDRLAASMPSGSRFSYRDASYSLFSRSLILKGAVLHTVSPALDVAVDEVRIQDGNPHLDKAVEEAQSAPSLDDQAETKIAGKVTLVGLHTVNGPLDARAGALEVDDPRIVLKSLFAPLPGLAPGDTSPDSNDGNAALRLTMQRMARGSLAASFDRMTLDELDLVASDHVSDQSVKVHVGKAQAANDNQGDIKTASVDDLAVTAQDVTASIGSIRGDVGEQRPFLTDLRNGASLSAAFAHYPGVSETVGYVTVKRGGTTLGSVQEATMGNVQYRNGIPVSLDMTVKKLTVDPSVLSASSMGAILTALGYTPPVLDFVVSYKFDLARQQLAIAGTSLSLEQGGTLNLDAVLAGIAPGLPPQGTKVASLTARYQDNSLYPRWVDYVAKLTGKTAIAVKTQYVATVEKQKVMLHNDKPLTAAADAIEKFLSDPHELLLTVRPPAPVGLVDFDAQHPETFSGKLGLTMVANGAGPSSLTPSAPHPAPAGGPAR